MFKFLKEKLKTAVSKFSKKVEESEEKEEVTEEDIEEVSKTDEGKSFLAKIKEKFKKKEETEEEEKPEKKEIKKKKPRKEKEEKPKKVEEKKAVKKKEKKEKPEEAKEEIVKEKPEKKEEKIKEIVEEKPKLKKAEIKEEAEEKPEEPEEKKEEEAEETKEEKPEEEKESLFKKFTKKFTKKKEETEEKAAEEAEEERKEAEEKKEETKKEKKEKETKEEKKTLLTRISDVVTKRSLSDEKFGELFWELEVALLENNVAVEVIEKIKDDLKQKLVKTKIRFGKTFDVIESTLEKSIEGLFDIQQISLIEKAKEKKPLVVCFVGVNGSGKTTTIAKVAQLLKNHNLSCVIAAADTFRAAAIHQLDEHAQRLDVKLIKHDYGADPAAVAFDAIEHAKSKDKDVVLIDTAGRQHSNVNLVDEMKKIVRVANPDLKIFVGDSLTGNDTVEQSKSFDEAIGIDAIILTKVDVDEKGGAALSISYVTGKPIIYVGVGQEYDDLKEFDKQLVLKTLEMEA